MSKVFEFLGYLIQWDKSDTGIWVQNKARKSLGYRNDILFRIKRTYARDEKIYYLSITIGKHQILIAKI